MNMLGRKMDWNDAEDRKEYDKIRSKKYRVENKEKISAMGRKYRESNVDILKSRRRKYYKNNKDKFKKYSEDNKKKIVIRSKKYRQRPEVKEKAKIYRKNNKDHIKMLQKNYKNNNKDEIEIKRLKYYEDNKGRMAVYHKQYNQKNKKNICIICGKPALIKYCSPKCQGIGQRGENNSQWKGGITPINLKIRMSKEYALWRAAVFERDNYTCIWCGQHGGELNADHIKPFSLYPELRFAIDNGRTLCEDCHRTTDTFGKKTNLKIIEKEVKKRC